MDYFTSFVRRTSTLLAAVGVCFLVGMMLVIVANIISRLFDIPILGTYEAVELLAVPMVAFGIVYCALMQNHVAVTFVLTRLRQPVRRILAVVTTLLSLALWVLIAWKGAEFAGQQWQLGEATVVMNWPVYPLRCVFVLGTIVMCLLLFVDLFKALRGQQGNEPN